MSSATLQFVPTIGQGGGSSIPSPLRVQKASANEDQVAQVIRHTGNLIRGQGRPQIMQFPKPTNLLIALPIANTL